MRLIDFKSLRSVKGINHSRDHLRRKWKASEFPKPVPVSDRRIAWIETEIDEWLAARVAERDTPKPPQSR
jgi:prophage regulatory protein